MLRPKFLVSVGFRNVLGNLRNTQTRNASRCERVCPTAEKKEDDCPKPCPKHQKEMCPRPRFAINPFGRGSAADKEIRLAMPKPKVQPTCNVSKMLHPKYSCANAPPHPAEEFRDAYSEVREEALDTQIFVRVVSNNVIEPMIQRNRERAAEEKDRLKLLLGNLKPKIDELIELSLICGSREQAKLYRMSEKMHAELQGPLHKIPRHNFIILGQRIILQSLDEIHATKIWSCANVSGENCVKCRLQQLEWTVKERTDTAVEIVRTCNRSVTPESLLLCVDLTKKDAKCILQRINETIKKEVTDIEELKLKFFLEGDKILIDLKKKQEGEINNFSCHLTLCIEELKKYAKKFDKCD